MNRALHDTWWRLATIPPRSISDSLLTGVLSGASALYRTAVTVRNAGYDAGWLRQTRLPCPVISIGNLTVGGAGKTTCVAFLASKLTRQGRRVAVLSRGYGGTRPAPYVLNTREGHLEVNGRREEMDGLPDEPHMLAMQLPGVPVVIGKCREETGRMILRREHVNVILLDDGLQYRRLARDLEIILVNATMPLDGWALFPRGPMREPLATLWRADVIVITKADQSLDRVSALQERIAMLNPRAAMATAIHEPEGLWDAVSSEPVPLDRLGNARVALVSSIGDPDSFDETVRRLGAVVATHIRYPDHHRYDMADWQRISQAASASNAAALLTTEKDLMRLRPAARAASTPMPVWVLRVGMRLVSGEDELDARLARL
jgi:tetraacyldisaccharide 4'-kinase